MRTTFVTGGSGFVGRSLLRALRDRGDTVRALARGDAAAAVVSRLGATPVRGDLDQVAALREGMRGADVVVHAAGYIAEWGSPATFERINVAGTRNVLAAARAAGVPRLVHLSSNAVMIDGSPLVRVDETRPAARRPLPRYCASKAAAEVMVLEANDAALQTSAIRPVAIWGPGDTSTLPQLVDAVRAGRWLWIDGGRQLSSTCHVVNAVDGILQTADRGQGGAVYYVTDGEPVVFRDFMTRLMATQGVTINAREISRGIARAAARTSEAVWNTLRLPGQPPVTRLGLAFAGEEFTCVDAKARREIGYTSPMSVAEGLREMERLGPPQAIVRVPPPRSG